MPQCSGLDAVRAIRQIDAKTPVVMVTSTWILTAIAAVVLTLTQLTGWRSCEFDIHRRWYYEVNAYEIRNRGWPLTYLEDSPEDTKFRAPTEVWLQTSHGLFDDVLRFNPWSLAIDMATCVVCLVVFTVVIEARRRRRAHFFQFSLALFLIVTLQIA